MEKPTPKALVEAAGISSSYAYMILSDETNDQNKSRTPPRPLAILIFRKTGWKHLSIANLTDEEIDVIERVEPWTPRTQDEAA